jgi:hypothetical protein
MPYLDKIVLREVDAEDEDLGWLIDHQLVPICEISPCWIRGRPLLS